MPPLPEPAKLSPRMRRRHLADGVVVGDRESSDPGVHLYLKETTTRSPKESGRRLAHPEQLAAALLAAARFVRQDEESDTASFLEHTADDQSREADQFLDWVDWIDGEFMTYDPVDEATYRRKRAQFDNYKEKSQ